MVGVDARVTQRLFATNDPQVMAIRRVIRLGAVPVPAQPPAIHGGAWVHNDIDRFVVGAWAGGRSAPGGDSAAGV
jgi:hypothetical protein